MLSTSYIILNKKALKQNIRYLKKRIGEDVKFTSVIKGNAYGHSIEKFLPMAESCGVDYFAVFDSYEAERALKVKSSNSELMIMGAIDNEDLPWAIENHISFYVFDFNRLEKAIAAAKYMNKTACIHIEVETGLNRTGFDWEMLPQVAKFVNEESQYIQVEGICTHYAGAESVANYLRIQKQMDRFNKCKDFLKSKGITPNYYHTASSAAALIYPETRMDMVRFGIAHYGFWPSEETKMHNLLSDSKKFTRDPLHSVLQWKTKIMSLKWVKQGEFISYGNSFLASKKRLIAGIPIGYYHGYRRSLSNVGHVLIRGRKSRVVGYVNMNMFLADVTNIQNVKLNDEVVLIGKQGKQRISVASFSELSNFLNYELLSRLPIQIPRIIVEK
ncbi:MAG: alanine racemase [Candidatus Cloacimonadota bacterium]|nr:alanine racemase [Candidatus Cloacimonadota bacterium]